MQGQGLGERDEKLGEDTVFLLYTAVSQLVCLALGGHLCNIKGSLRQLLISCWKELGINMDSGLLSILVEALKSCISLDEREIQWEN